MFIQTEQTPNPATLKFLPGRMVMPAGTADFTDAEAAARLSPLAERLFALPQVTGVFLGADFITVTKDAEGDWYQLKPGILAVIMEHFTAGRPIVLAEAAGGAVMEAQQKTRTKSFRRLRSCLRHAYVRQSRKMGETSSFKTTRTAWFISTCRVRAQGARARLQH